MESNFEIQDISLILAVTNLNPLLLTLEFLQGSGIIPQTWELAQPPVLSTGSARLVFRNGSSLVAEPGKVTFTEVLSPNKALEAVEIAEIAGKYVATLPNLDYRAVGINPRCFVTFRDRPEAAHRFITETILSPGNWQEVGLAPVEAGINLTYALEGRVLRWNIKEARLQLGDSEAIPAVLFASNFHYDLAGEMGQERSHDVQQHLKNWRTDLEMFRDLANNRFLAGFRQETVFPVRGVS